MEEDFPIDYTTNELRLLRYYAMTNHLAFARIFLKHRDNTRFILGRHHSKVAEVLDGVFSGKYKRLLITIPPGCTKTELAVIMFIARGLAINPRSRFIHTSSGKNLPLFNSAQVRDVVELPLYQAFWPMEIRVDYSGKGQWYNQEGGGLYATGAKGQVTGFRAGRMGESGFSGAFVIDDSLKPEEAESLIERDKVNRMFNNTARNRLAVPSIPIIVIGQRLHQNDLPGFLLTGGSGDVWDHLDLGVEIEEDYVYPEEWTHGRLIPHDLEPGLLWSYKYDEAEIKVLKTDKYVFSAQFKQRPTVPGGSIFHGEDFPRYRADRVDLNLNTIDGVEILYKMIYADTAHEKGKLNDFSVIQCWAKGADGRIYLLDQVRGKWEAPELEDQFEDFCKKHEFRQGQNSMGVRARKVENKSSGIGLRQAMNKKFGTDYVEGIPRDRDKVSRAYGGAPSVARGEVVLPDWAPWLEKYVDEFEAFTPKMTHDHDDQIDPTLDAIQDMLIEDAGFSYRNVV